MYHHTIDVDTSKRRNKVMVMNDDCINKLRDLREVLKLYSECLEIHMVSYGYSPIDATHQCINLLKKAYFIAQSYIICIQDKYHIPENQ